MATIERPATDSFDRNFYVMDNNPIKDPRTGQIINRWSQGMAFRGALSILQSTEALIAQAQTGLELGILAVNKVNDFPINTYFLDPLHQKYYRIANTGQRSSDAISFEQIQFSVVWVPALPA